MQSCSSTCAALLANAGTVMQMLRPAEQQQLLTLATAAAATATAMLNYYHSVLQWRLMKWRSYLTAVKRVKWAEDIALRMHTTRLLQRWHSKVSTHLQ
jgi:hypothetical protein